VSAALDTLLNSLRDLARAHDRLSRAVPDPETAVAAVDAALANVVTLLDDPGVAGPLMELIAGARERAGGASGGSPLAFAERRPELVAIEAKLTRRLGTTEDDLHRMYAAFERSRERLEVFSGGIDDIKQQLIKVHESTKAQVADSRNMSRKEKKKRKRKLGQGIASAIFGTGVIAADSQLPLLFAFSYGLGGSALHQALRDIVGEEAD